MGKGSSWPWRKARKNYPKLTESDWKVLKRWEFAPDSDGLFIVELDWAVYVMRMLERLAKKVGA